MAQASEAQALKPGVKSHSLQPPGYLLGRFGQLLLLGFLILAAWDRQVVIVILLSLALSSAGLAKLWGRLSLVGVTCQRSLSEHRVFPGESIDLKVRLANRKLLPLPWVQVDDSIPEQLAPQGASLGAPADRPGCRWLTHAASLLWYTAINWRAQLLCRKRGYYQLGPVTVSSGDIFGFYPRSAEQPLVEHVIVYPKIYPLGELGIPSLYPIGETKAERRIFEDLTRPIGVRDYTPQDSLRHVHWKASARHQNLQVKVFEPTTTLKVALFLDVDHFMKDGVSGDDFELAVSAVASVANYIVEQRSLAGLFANCRLPDTGEPARVLPAGGLSQLVYILETLAKVTAVPSGPFEEYFQGQLAFLPWGTTIVLAVHHPAEPLVRLLVGLKESGYKVLVLQIAEGSRDGAEQYTTAWYDIRAPGDLLATGGAR